MMTTETIVIQKNADGHALLSLIANITVNINIITSIVILHTTLVVKFPPNCKKIFAQLNTTFGTCEAKPIYAIKFCAYGV